MAMMESKACFTLRLAQLGIPELATPLANRRIATLSELAYCCAYVPGQADETPFLEGLVKAVGVDVADARVGALRRLFYEAFALAAVELKAKGERTSEDAPRRLPNAERAARFESLQTRLVGIRLTEELEPSHQLVDTVAQIVEDGHLRYVAWDACTKRSAEVQGIRKDRIWRPDAQGVIRETRPDVGVPADISSDMLLHFALQRRSAAFEMGGLCTWEVHEEYRAELLAEYTRPPPPGYTRVALAQVERADREAFRLMAEQTRAGLQPPAVGKLPLDNLLLAARRSHTVAQLLAPLPGSAPRAAPAETAAKQNNKRKAHAEPSSGPGSGKHPRAKAKAKAGAVTKPTVMPTGLRGKVSRDAEGRNICFAYNLPKGCLNKAAECNRGRHVCCNPGCFGDHPVHQCKR
jgi:hypothetical protein